MRQCLFVIAAVATTLGLVACGVTPRSAGGPATDYATLVSGLRAAGATVVGSGHISQPFLATPGQVIAINGEQTQVYQYSDAATAAAQAARISADGSKVESASNVETQVDWIAPPHFYESGELLVIYVGTNGTVLNLLAAQLGPQFAGA